jgi:hypothetical protein
MRSWSCLIELHNNLTSYFTCFSWHLFWRFSWFLFSSGWLTFLCNSYRFLIIPLDRKFELGPKICFPITVIWMIYFFICYEFECSSFFKEFPLLLVVFADFLYWPAPTPYGRGTAVPVVCGPPIPMPIPPPNAPILIGPLDAIIPADAPGCYCRVVFPAEKCWISILGFCM